MSKNGYLRGMLKMAIKLSFLDQISSNFTHISYFSYIFQKYISFWNFQKFYLANLFQYLKTFKRANDKVPPLQFWWFFFLVKALILLFQNMEKHPWLGQRKKKKFGQIKFFFWKIWHFKKKFSSCSNCFYRKSNFSRNCWI